MKEWLDHRRKWIERLPLNYVVILVTMVVMYISLIKTSWGAECLFLALLLIGFNTLCERRTVILVMPTLLLCGIVLVLLVVSGRMGEVDFNAPIGHALKYVYILFTHAILNATSTLDNKKKRKVVILVFLTYIVSCLVSLYFVIFEDAYAIRYFEDKGFLYVLDFNQMYALPIIFAVVVCGIFSTMKNLKSVLVFLPFLIVSFVCICLSLYTTALLLTLLGCGLASLFALFYRSKKWFFITIGALFLIVLICVIFSQPVADLLYAMTEKLNWLVRARVRAVIEILFGTDHENWYAPDRRNELAGFSLATFYENPLIGVGYTGFGYEVIGNHHEWYDMLGTFGIVGVALFLVVILNMVIQVVNSANNLIDLGCFVIALVMLVVLGFLNPCLNIPVLLAVFVIAPNISTLVTEKKERKEG